MTTEYSEERRNFFKSMVVLGGAVAALAVAQGSGNAQQVGCSAAENIGSRVQRDGAYQ